MINRRMRKLFIAPSESEEKRTTEKAIMYGMTRRTLF